MSALLFSAATGDRVDCGSGASIDALQGMTAYVLANPAILTNDRVFLSKYRGSVQDGWQLTIGGTTGNVQLLRERGPDQLYISNSTPLAVTNRWYFVAFASDANGANIYTGGLSRPLTEVTYGTATAGAGIFIDDSTRLLMIGNRDAATPNAAFTGMIAAAGVVNRRMELREIKEWLSAPYVCPNGLVGQWYPGEFGNLNLQKDYSGRGNHGTVTGATYARAPELDTWFMPRRMVRFPQAVAAGGARPILVGGKLVGRGLLRRGLAA